jgi:tetratricopeptide (TPR) repeat protein
MFGFGAKNLSRQVHSQITALSEQGSEQFDAGQYEEALRLWCQALELIPEPRENWEASTWVFTSIGDALYHLGRFEKALDALSNAIRCPDGLGNPYLHLRLGQVQFELGNQDRAADELMRAYMGGGPEIFEDDEPKYLDFLKTRAQL